MKLSTLEGIYKKGKVVIQHVKTTHTVDSGFKKAAERKAW